MSTTSILEIISGDCLLYTYTHTMVHGQEYSFWVPLWVPQIPPLTRQATQAQEIVMHAAKKNFLPLTREGAVVVTGEPSIFLDRLPRMKSLFYNWKVSTSFIFCLPESELITLYYLFLISNCSWSSQMQNSKHKCAMDEFWIKCNFCISDGEFNCLQ